VNPQLNPLLASGHSKGELPNGSSGERALRAAELLRDQYGLGDADSGYPSSGTTTIPTYLRAAGA